MLKVVIIGYGEMFTNLIAGTLDADCKIVGVLRKDTIKYPRFIRKIKDIINPSVEYNYIKSYHIPEIKGIKSVNSEKFRKELLKLNPDLVIVGSWGEKFSKETYSIPKIATINAHPSLLPKYRGPNPYFWVIKNQEQVTGVTFHLMDEDYDRGAILAQEEIKIFPADTGETLKKRTVLTARGVVCALLRDLSEDIIIPLQQCEDKASYYSYPDDLEISFRKTAEENYATIRAIHPWGEAYFYHEITALTPNPHKTFVETNNTKYTNPGTITSVDAEKKSISVLCEGGKILKMDDVVLYKKSDRIFTSNFIKLDVKEGNIII
ncbi:MAG: hypothetical protein MJ231_06415 [bacterium]|nr:hypothetical protein [bacterium]